MPSLAVGVCVAVACFLFLLLSEGHVSKALHKTAGQVMFLAFAAAFVWFASYLGHHAADAEDAGRAGGLAVLSISCLGFCAAFAAAFWRSL